MRDFCKFSDPTFNPAFRRPWADDPLDERGLQHLGREVAPRVAEGAGQRAVARWLDTAAQAQGAAASKAFEQADAIRRRFGLDWTDLIGQRSAA